MITMEQEERKKAIYNVTWVGSLVNFLLVTVIQVATFGTRYLWATWLEFLFWMIIVLI